MEDEGVISLIFVDENGEALRFYMPPSNDKAFFKPTIEVGFRKMCFWTGFY